MIELGGARPNKWSKHQEPEGHEERPAQSLRASRPHAHHAEGR